MKYYTKAVHVNEGVADKYLETKFNIKDKNTEFDSWYNRKSAIDRKKAKVFGPYEDRHTQFFIHENPNDLTLIKPYSRGVIAPTGDLYIADKPDALHLTIIKILINKGILDKNAGWEHYNDYEYATYEGCMAVVMMPDNTFMLSESYSPNIVDSKYEKVIKDYAQKFKITSPDKSLKLEAWNRKYR